jgi:hypothetical protein
MERRETRVSYLVTAPEEVGAAARDLAGIRSLLAGSATSAAAPTAAVAAAAQDEVSAWVATMFSDFGQEFQALNAQADAFHEQFVGLINAGAGAYLSTEVANAGAISRAAAADLSLSSILGGSASLSLDGGVLSLPPILGGGVLSVPSLLTGGVLNLPPILGGAQLTVPPISSVGSSILNAMSPIINGGVVGLPPILDGGELTVPSILTGGVLDLPASLSGGVLGLPSIVTGGLLSLPSSLGGGVFTVPPISSVLTSILNGGAVDLPPILGGGQLSVPSILAGGVLSLPPIAGGGNVSVPSILTGGVLTLPPIVGGGDIGPLDRHRWCADPASESRRWATDGAADLHWRLAGSPRRLTAIANLAAIAVLPVRMCGDAAWRAIPSSETGQRSCTLRAVQRSSL